MCITSIILLHKRKCYIFSTVQNKFAPYTVLFSSKLPTMLTALCHESLFIATSFASDLNNLFIESCVQRNASRAASHFRGRRRHPTPCASTTSEQASENHRTTTRPEGQPRVILFLSGRKRGFVPEVPGGTGRRAGHRPAQTALRPGRKRRLPLAQGLALSPPGPSPPVTFWVCLAFRTPPRLRNQLRLSPLTRELKRALSPSSPAPPQASAAGSSSPSERPQRCAPRRPGGRSRSRSRRIGAWPPGETAPPPRCPQVPRHEPGPAPGPHTPGWAGGRGLAEGRRLTAPGWEGNSRRGRSHWWESVPIFAASQSGAADHSGRQPCCPYPSERRPEAPPGADRRPNR